jgi:CheY-like chemotaxis protein
MDVIAVAPTNAPASDVNSFPVPKVLLVEDEVLLRLTTADELREEGFEVIEASSGDEAIALLKTAAPIDVVVTDIQMPGNTDGVGLAHFIAANRSELKVIMTSGDLRAPPKGCRINAFFSKPYEAFDVAQLIRALLEP